MALTINGELLPGERVVFRTRMGLVKYLLQVTLWGSIGMAMASLFLSDVPSMETVVTTAIACLFGTLSFAGADAAVTDMRLLYRVSYLSPKIVCVRLYKIARLDVNRDNRRLVVTDRWGGGHELGSIPNRDRFAARMAGATGVPLYPMVSRMGRYWVGMTTGLVAVTFFGATALSIIWVIEFAPWEKLGWADAHWGWRLSAFGGCYFAGLAVVLPLAVVSSLWVAVLPMRVFLSASEARNCFEELLRPNKARWIGSLARRFASVLYNEKI